MKNYYVKQAEKLVKMNVYDAKSFLRLARRFNGRDEADKIVAEISGVLGGVRWAYTRN